MTSAHLVIDAFVKERKSIRTGGFAALSDLAVVLRHLILAVNPDVDKALLHMRRLTRSLLAYVQDIEALGTAETGLPDGLLSDDCGFVHESALPSIFIAFGGISFSDADLILLLARVKVDASGVSGSSSAWVEGGLGWSLF